MSQFKQYTFFLFAIVIFSIATPTVPQTGDGEPGLDSPDAFEQIQHTVGQLGKIRNSLTEKRREVRKTQAPETAGRCGRPGRD